MKRLIFIIVIFISTLFSCDYDYVPYFEAPKPQIELQDLPAYAHFKTGTYWIYKDSASGIEDSVYVFYDTVFQYHLGPGNAQAEGDYMQYEWHSHNFTDEYNYDYKIDYGFYGLASKLVGVERWKFKPGDYVGNSYMMSNIFDSNYPFGYYGSPGTIYFKEKFDSLTIGGNIIRNVVHFQDTENASENIFFPGYGSLNPRTDYYIAKNIGVVKIRITDHTQFNLINKMQYLARYHIIQ